MKFRVAFYTLLVALSACGDNSNECDPGTTRNENGVCVGNLSCSDGTVLVDGKCEIDPNACQGGTVLVGGECVDPGVLTADLEEGAEPNGLGLIEQSLDPAGEIMLKAEGQHFVIHGKIEPFRDEDGDGQQDADIDTYVLEVTEPTLLTITADGVNGLAAGFVSVAAVSSTNPLSDWTRFGINLTGDTSKRQLFLPVAGVYLIGIGDTRTLFLSGGAAGAAEGKPAFEYYVSIDRTPINPTALTVTNGVATSTGMRQPGEVKLFTVPLGEGINNAELATAVPQVQASLVVTNKRANTTKLLGIGDAQDPDPAAVGALGVRTGDTSLVVADSVFDYANQPYAYDLLVNVGTAGALSTSGGDVAQPASTTLFSVYYYDVTPDGLTVGMDLSFDVPVMGVIVDEDFNIFSAFTFDLFFGTFNDTFQEYLGLLKHATPGRYYFLTFDPLFDGSTPADITATSSYATLTPTPIVKGTPLTNQAVNAFASNPLSYAPGAATDPWQLFTGSGTGTGTIVASFYDTSAIGRLDPLTLLDGTCFVCEDSPVPVFAQTYAAAGTTTGRILVDNQNINSFFVKVNTATTTGSPTFNLDYKAAANVTDLGNVNVGATVTSNDKPLDATNPVQRFIVRGTGGNGAQISATPDVAGLDTRIQRVNVNAAPAGGVVNNGAAGAADTTVAPIASTGWTAFTVDSAAGTGTFDLSVTGLAPKNYTITAGTTAYSDACTGGTTIALNNTDEGASVATIATPAGFDFFGFPAPELRLFSNGFVTFDTSVACAAIGDSCFFTNADMPSAAEPNGIIAPYWDDLITTSACQKVVGNQLILQWKGRRYASAAQVVAMQVIIDGSNDTIEFVYDTTHSANTASATVGAESQGGNLAAKVLFNTGTTAPTGKLFTPM